MRKNLFRDWSKSDFGYALKIIANVVLITASVVFTLNVSSSYLWQSIILGIVFFNRQFLYGILQFKFQKRYLYRKRTLFCGFLSGCAYFQFI